MSKDPESVPFVQRDLQTLALAAGAGVSKPDERWFMLARYAAVLQGDNVVDQCELKPFSLVSSSNY